MSPASAEGVSLRASGPSVTADAVKAPQNGFDRAHSATRHPGRDRENSYWSIVGYGFCVYILIHWESFYLGNVLDINYPRCKPKITTSGK